MKQYCDTNGLTVNTNKTEYLVFRKGKRGPNHTAFLYDGVAIKSTNAFSYLGVTLQACTHGYAKHIAHRSSLAISAAMAFNKKHRLLDLQWKSCVKIFNACIRPVATYGLEVCKDHISENDWTLLNSVWLRFVKLALGLPKQAPNCAVYLLSKSGPLCCSFSHTIELERHNHPKAVAPKQGCDWSHRIDYRANNLGCYVDCTEMTGVTRAIISKFALNGFHAQFCAEKCHNTRMCLHRVRRTNPVRSGPAGPAGF